MNGNQTINMETLNQMSNPQQGAMQAPPQPIQQPVQQNVNQFQQPVQQPVQPVGIDPQQYQNFLEFQKNSSAVNEQAKEAENIASKITEQNINNAIQQNTNNNDVLHKQLEEQAKALQEMRTLLEEKNKKSIDNDNTNDINNMSENKNAQPINNENIENFQSTLQEIQIKRAFNLTDDGFDFIKNVANKSNLDIYSNPQNISMIIDTIEKQQNNTFVSNSQPQNIEQNTTNQFVQDRVNLINSMRAEKMEARRKR